MYKGNLNENHSSSVCLYENRRPLSPYPDSLVEELKCVHLQYYI